MADEFNICPESWQTASRTWQTIVLSNLAVTSDTIFKNQCAATHLPELILSFRKQVEDALYFFKYFAIIDPSIEENIDPLNTAAAEFLQDIQEELDVLSSRHFILTAPQNNQFINPAMSFCQKFEPSSIHEAVFILFKVTNDVEEVLKSVFRSCSTWQI